jgi:hypothetical protein
MLLTTDRITVVTYTRGSTTSAISILHISSMAPTTITPTDSLTNDTRIGCIMIVNVITITASSTPIPRKGPAALWDPLLPTTRCLPMLVPAIPTSA